MCVLKKILNNEKMNLILFLPLFALMNVSLMSTVTDSQQQTTQCDNKALKKFDSDIARLITIGNSGRKFPENKGEDLRIFCDTSFKLILEIEEYKNRCLRNLPRQVSGVLIFAVKNAIKQYCRKDSKKLTELIAATPCLNTANSEITKCYTAAIDAFQGAKYAKESKRIPHVCCEYFKVFPCFQKRAERYSMCTTKHVDTASDFVRTIFDNIVDLICGDYTENSDKCDNLESTPKKKRSDKRTKSFAIPLIEVLDSFPEVNVAW